MRRAIGGVLIAILAFGTVQAGTGSGTIVNFTPAVINGTEFFVLTLSITNGQPACVNSPRFALSASDPKYKTVVALPFGAYFSGASIYVNGAGTCNTYGGSEDLSYVCLNGGVPC
jgi:hypothetical protein